MSYTLTCTSSTPIGDTMSLADISELGWLVVACFVAAFIFKQLGKSL
jgi:hypothetical protein